MSWSWLLLDKLTGRQLVKKFPAFYGSRMLITTAIRTRHLYLSLARSIKSMPPCPSSWNFILILPSHLHQVFKVVSFPQASPPKPCMHLSSLPYVIHVPHLILLYLIIQKNMVRITEHKTSGYVVFSTPLLRNPLRSKYLPQYPFL